jgi:hypothetical protein
MGISGLDGLSDEEINRELQNGARFVVFQYTISIIVMTFKRSSDVYFIRSGQSVVGKSMGFSLVTLLLGWWGIPWGPIYTIGSLFTNISGGTDVTDEVLASLSGDAVGEAGPAAAMP